MDAPWSSNSPWNDEVDVPAHLPASLPTDDPWASVDPTPPADRVETLNTSFHALSTSPAQSVPWDTRLDTGSKHAKIAEDEDVAAVGLASSHTDPWATTDTAASWDASPTVSKHSWSVDDAIGDGAGAGSGETWAGDSGADTQTVPEPDAETWHPNSIRGAQLDRDHIDSLKQQARNLVTSVHGSTDDNDTDGAAFASSFSVDPDATEVTGFGQLFGSEGSKRELMTRLGTPPAALIGSDGVSLQLATVWPNCPTTRERLALGIRSTQHRTVKLVAPDSFTTTTWTRTDLSGGRKASVEISSANNRPSLATSVVEPASGPGWTHTSARDSSSRSGGGASTFIASFFKSRPPTTTTSPPAAPPLATSSHMRKSSSSTQTRRSVDASVYRDDYQVGPERYSDDPTGPDLLNLADSSPAPGTAAAAAPTLMSRWRSSGVFARTPTPPTSNSITSTDKGWTRSFSKAGLRTSKAPSNADRYFDDDDDEASSPRFDAYLYRDDDEPAPKTGSADPDDAFSGLWDTAPAPPPITSIPPVRDFKQASALPPPPHRQQEATKATPTSQNLLFDDYDPAPPPLAPLPSAAKSPTHSHGKTSSATLTADDLLFFDNL